MIKKPFINALLAVIYIVLVVILINTFGNIGEDKPETIIIPMMMLSLLVLSVATMGYLFVYQPLTLYLDNKKEEALSYFLKTLGFFAIFTFIFIAIYVSTIL